MILTFYQNREIQGMPVNEMMTVTKTTKALSGNCCCLKETKSNANNEQYYFSAACIILLLLTILAYSELTLSSLLHITDSILWTLSSSEQDKALSCSEQDKALLCSELNKVHVSHGPILEISALSISLLIKRMSGNFELISLLPQPGIEPRLPRWKTRALSTRPTVLNEGDYVIGTL